MQLCLLTGHLTIHYHHHAVNILFSPTVCDKEHQHFYSAHLNFTKFHAVTMWSFNFYRYIYTNLELLLNTQCSISRNTCLVSFLDHSVLQQHVQNMLVKTQHFPQRCGEIEQPSEKTTA